MLPDDCEARGAGAATSAGPNGFETECQVHCTFLLPQHTKPFIVADALTTVAE